MAAPAVAPEPPEDSRTPYERLVRWSAGDFPEPDVSVQEFGVFGALTDQLYVHVFADEELFPKFREAAERRNLDPHGEVFLTWLRRHMSAFLIYAAGGPNRYTGRGLKRAHDGLGLTDGHLDRVIVCATRAGQDLKVPAGIIAELGAALEGARGDVVTVKT